MPLPDRTFDRARRLLPGYLAGGLSRRRTRWLEMLLADSEPLRRECQSLRLLAETLRRHDPASPPERAATDALRRRLAAELPAAAPRRLVPALRTAAVFGLGCLAGSLLFPRVEVRQSVRERRVAVAVPVIKPVTITVEKRVEVPVEKVVTRWRTETVTRTRVVYRDRPAPARAAKVERPRPAVPVLTVEPADTRRGGTGMAMLPAGDRPAVVDF